MKTAKEQISDLRFSLSEAIANFEQINPDIEDHEIPGWVKLAEQTLEETKQIGPNPMKVMLQKVVDQTERAEKKAFEAMNPIAMVLHPKSILVSEIREFLK